MSNNDNAKKLIERYRSVQHNTLDEPLGKMVYSAQGLSGLQFTNAIIDAAIDLAKKYRLAKSAIAMLQFLQKPVVPDKEISLTLPPHDMWIELEEPINAPQGIFAGVELMQFRRRERFERALKLVPLHPSQRKIMEYNLFEFDPPGQIFDHRENVWSYSIVGTDGRVYWKIALKPEGENTVRFMLPPDFTCPTNSCTRDENIVRPCQACQDVMAFYSSWLNPTLLMISGAFAEDEEMPNFERVSEQVIRRVPRENNPKKSKVILQTHHYSIVTFDACLRKTSPPQEKMSTRGSWLEATQAINPELIVYVEHHIAKTQRTFRHERYINKRGQTITVKAHDKRIPMKASVLKHKITRVIASKYM